MSSISISWTSIMSTGGPTVAIYAYMIVSFSTIMVGLAMAEICSTFPSAGSVYHWAGSEYFLNYTVLLILPRGGQGALC